MKVLVFEYSTVIFEDNLISEGLNMLKSLLSDLDGIKEYDVTYLLNKNLKIDIYPHSNVIYIDCDLCEWLDNNCSNYDCCIFIAPEDDLIQYNITCILEKNDVFLIGPTSNASYICSSKYKTYIEVPSNIRKIPSFKIDVSMTDYDYINKHIDLKDSIIKPDDKTSSNLIYHIHNIEELKKIITTYEKNSIKTAIIQQYIVGTPISISAICNNKYIKCISINSQEITESKNQIKYMGCKTPIEHPLKERIIDISKDIIKSINGLYGFIGIDYIISKNEIYFVEINSRITTPYIVLHNIVNVNLTQTIIELLLADKKREITINNNGTFYK